MLDADREGAGKAGTEILASRITMVFSSMESFFFQPKLPCVHVSMDRQWPRIRNEVLIRDHCRKEKQYACGGAGILQFVILPYQHDPLLKPEAGA